MERLSFGLLDLKLAEGAGQDTASMTFSGYGAVFGNMDAYGDVIAKGAFTKTIAEFKTSGVWPAMLLQHGGWGIGADDFTPVGVWTEIREDGHGLYVEGTLADTPRGREIYTLMKMKPRPAINGMSIGYIAKEWVARSKPEEPRRTLTAIELVEVSLVTFPANGKARVTGVKSDGECPTIREAEFALREAGFSRKQAKLILADGFKGLPLRDAEEGDVGELAAMVRRNIDALRA
ncbi:HK97 family phage prohead protease [Nitratidesulfovibrio sp. 1201_IL3209]|uniref:HK97 family phage prohead protease n=1 Tax=Nitratidesulfovibrio sp. 1201_IL3209 TaxID=3084053 RepID=UPI002FD8A9ED